MSGWNNQLVTLIVLVEEAGGFSGLFGYSPAPGHGNLVLSITSAGGTDPYGNNYPAGATFGDPSVGKTLIDLQGIIHLAGSDGHFVIVLNPEKQAVLIYDDPPGTGQLSVSIAAAAGTDQFGNTFPAGLHWNTVVQNLPTPINGWGVGGHAQYALDALGNLVVSLKDLVPGTTTDGTDLWPPGTLTGAYVVPDNRRVVCYTNATNGDTSAALEFVADGSISCYGIGAGASRADLFATVPVSF